MQLKCIVFGEEITIDTDKYPDLKFSGGASLHDDIDDMDEIIRDMPLIEDCPGTPSTDMRDFEEANEALLIS